jgi:thiol-disulfide isomerase/thioredoxin
MRFLLAILLVLCFAICVYAVTVEVPAVPATTGKPLVVLLKATWCPDCQALKPYEATLKAHGVQILDYDRDRVRVLAFVRRPLLPTLIIEEPSKIVGVAPVRRVLVGSAEIIKWVLTHKVQVKIVPVVGVPRP